MHENKYIKLSHFRCHVSQLTMCVPQSSTSTASVRDPHPQQTVQSVTFSADGFAFVYHFLLKSQSHLLMFEQVHGTMCKHSQI